MNGDYNWSMIVRCRQECSSKLRELPLDVIMAQSVLTHLQRRLVHERRKGQQDLAVGSNGGRTFLSPDLQSVSQRYCERIAQAGRPHSLGTCADQGIGIGKRHD